MYFFESEEKFVFDTQILFLEGELFKGENASILLTSAVNGLSIIRFVAEQIGLFRLMALPFCTFEITLFPLTKQQAFSFLLMGVVLKNIGPLLI